MNFLLFSAFILGDNQDIIPAVLPMFHIYGMTVNALKTLSVGCKMITLPKFTPDIYANMLVKHRPHHLFLVPPIGKLKLTYYLFKVH